MSTILGFLGLIVGTIIFFVINENISITYFGCRAILSLWGGCVLFTTAAFIVLGSFVIGLLKWVLIIAAVIGIIGFVGSKIKGSKCE